LEAPVDNYEFVRLEYLINFLQFAGYGVEASAGVR
jgi:hypothetical protein